MKKEGAMKDKKYYFIPSMIAALFLSLVMPSVVSAVTIAFDWTDFRISTVTNLNYPLNSNPTSAPALPPDDTFTLAPSLPINPSSNNYFTNNQGKFERYTFDLPAGFSDLSFSFRIAVDDWFAIYINDTVVAIQTTTSTENFYEPFPGFSMNTDGTATDTSGGKLEYLLASGMHLLFQSGTNELTVFGRDTWWVGGFGLAYGEIHYNTTELPPPSVPEPATILLLSSGLTGWVGFRMMFKG
jgi:hypothetical protein